MYFLTPTFNFDNKKKFKITEGNILNGVATGITIWERDKSTGAIQEVNESLKEQKGSDGEK